MYMYMYDYICMYMYMYVVLETDDARRMCCRWIKLRCCKT